MKLGKKGRVMKITLHGEVFWMQPQRNGNRNYGSLIKEKKMMSINKINAQMVYRKLKNNKNIKPTAQ